ncbi:presequence protease, mitochondrial [Trichonephila clavipes]|nr:presequence protease, mitochondrial [Trichonephila clavipes]
MAFFFICFKFEKKGFRKEQIQSVLHKIELSTKHKTSNFGLNCALGVYSMWNHDGHPISAFKINDHIQWFSNQLKDNPHFLLDKIVQYFQNNPHKLTLIMKPSEHFESEQQAKEKELLNSKVSRLSDIEKQQIYQQGLELAEDQKLIDASCLPTLLIEDVKTFIEKTPLKFTSFNNIPIQICEQPTNEVTYFRALVDASELSEEEIMLLPLFTSIITEMGAGKRNYKELDQEIHLKTGKLDISLNISEHPLDPTKYQQALLLSSYCLDKNVKDMFLLWKDILTDVHLKDNERLTQLIRLSATEMAQSITHRGSHYSMMRACSSLSCCAHIRENTSGISQVDGVTDFCDVAKEGSVSVSPSLSRAKPSAPSRNNRTPSNELNKLLPKFDMKEDISLYLILFERQACMMNVAKEFWVSHLLGLLTQLIAREPEQEARDYDHVRSLLLKRFKLTPEKFRQLFITHQISSDKTWRYFYQEVQTFFNGWIEGLDVKTFDKLQDLMIADQMKKRAPVEFKECHLDEWPSINCPVELAERLEEFEDIRRTLKQKTHTLTPVRRPEVRGSNQAEHFRKFDNHNTRTGNFNPERSYLDTPPSTDFDRRPPRKCYICHYLDHLSFNCPEAMKEIKREQPHPQEQSCSVTPQKGLHLKSMLGN